MCVLLLPLSYSFSHSLTHTHIYPHTHTHTHSTGVADHYATSDLHALHLTRSIIASLNIHPHTTAAHTQTNKLPSDTHTHTHEAPKYDVQDLRGVVPVDSKKGFDVREVIARVVDGSRFQEFKAMYGTTIVTGVCVCVCVCVCVRGSGLMVSGAVRKRMSGIPSQLSLSHSHTHTHTQKHRLRPHSWHPMWHHRQQRHPLLRVLPQGRTLHSDM
jgi:hypothetical protein